ncbi:MAG: phosphodiester glycosidase family protein [Bacillota bacterium]|nr:phosphodiester glycosidase family protein [Bacillota bacterium]
MNKRSIKTIIIALALILCCTAAAAAASSSLYQASAPIAGDTQLYANSYYLDDGTTLISENYLLFTPGGAIQPVIGYGNTLHGAASLRTAVNVMAEQGYTVIAALNGDYFNISSGVPLGVVMYEGEIISSEHSSLPALGFKADGSAVIAKPGFSYTLSLPGGGSLAIDNINKELSVNAGLVAYTAEYADSDKAAIEHSYARLRVSGGRIAYGETLSAEVIAVGSSSSAVAVGSNELLLSIAASGSAQKNAALLALSTGDRVSLTVNGGSAFSGVQFAVGSAALLLDNGVSVATDSAGAQPQTAVGVKRNGDIVFYTADGRQSEHSHGLTLTQLAARLAELGCVDAVALDGGGSTFLAVLYPGYSLGTVNAVNQPSGGSLRSCGDYIFLVNTARATNVYQRLFIYPYNVTLLAGATQAFEAKGADANYYPLTLSGTPSFSADGVGSVDEAGLLTAAATAGSGTVTARHGAYSATAQVQVITAPHSISLYRAGESSAVGSAISVNGGESIDFNAAAVYNKRAVVAQDKCFNWSVSGNIGSVNADGLFTANSALLKGSGTLTAAAGGVSVSVTINVSSDSDIIDNFEYSAALFGSGEGISAAVNSDKYYVRYGDGSAAISYDFGLNGALRLPMSCEISSRGDYISLWLYGDGSGNKMSLEFTLLDGNTQVVDAAMLDVSGWMGVPLPIPDNAASISALLLSGGGSGRIYIDQLKYSADHLIDATPPTISWQLRSGGVYRATVYDAAEGAVAAAQISVRYDGALVAFAYDAGSGELTVSIPEDGAAHKLTVIAADSSGNLNSSFIEIAPSAAVVNPFLDMQDHWATDNTLYLYQHSIVSGIPTAGGLTYQPYANMTRAQFAQIIANYLGVDTAAYADTALPFTDAAAIPSWALNAVKAMYAEGVTQGTLSGGRLYFNPNGSISRAEAMTMIGRIQPRGYAEADLDFYDSNDIPAWSLPYIKTLVAQGVISGYNNNLSPHDYVTRAQVAKMIYSLL